MRREQYFFLERTTVGEIRLVRVQIGRGSVDVLWHGNVKPLESIAPSQLHHVGRRGALLLPLLV